MYVYTHIMLGGKSWVATGDRSFLCTSDWRRDACRALVSGRLSGYLPAEVFFYICFKQKHSHMFDMCLVNCSSFVL